MQRCGFQAGDRVGICVTQLDPKMVERGLACTPGSVPTFSGAIAAVEKIRFHTGAWPFGDARDLDGKGTRSG
jgi:hypothetical protein